MYKFFNISYSKGGRWYGLNTKAIDLFFTFLPVGNTIWCIYSWTMDSPYDKRDEPTSSNLDIFYNVKK